MTWSEPSLTKKSQLCQLDEATDELTEKVQEKDYHDLPMP
jgi:hypothetical protein